MHNYMQLILNQSIIPNPNPIVSMLLINIT